MNQFGIISPLLPEAKCLTSSAVKPDEIIRIEENICVYVSGIGAERAEKAARQLVSHGCDVLVSWGTAGALAADLRPGDLLIPESVIGIDGTVYHLAKLWRSSLANKLNELPANIYYGQIADSLRVIKTAQTKSGFRETHARALAVDMESAAIAAVADVYGLDCLVIRVICDSSDTTIPDFALKFTDQYGRAIPGKFMKSIFTDFRLLPQLAALASDFRHATRTLKLVGSRLKEILS